MLPKLKVTSNSSFSPWPSYSSEEIQAVSRLLKSNRVNYWTGNECREFEREFAAWIGVDYAVSLANGTIALEVALRAAGIGSGDDVVVTARSFFASASCIVAVGARPVFADVDLNSQNITADLVRDVLTSNTRAIICVHLAGMPCDMDPIMELAAEREIFVVEDCAQAHGAQYRGRKVGSIGHVAAWSFCQDKIMTTGGEGGMVTTDDPELWARMWSYKDHGKSWNAVYARDHPPGFRWVHESFGSNGRMLEFQAVIGRIQLRRMDEWTRRRNEIASSLRLACEESDVVRVPIVSEDFLHAYYRFYLFVRTENLAHGVTRDRVLKEIEARGVPCYQGTCSEIYCEKAFDNTEFRPVKRLPNAHELGQTGMAFLVHPTLTDEEVDLTCESLKNVFREASA